MGKSIFGNPSTVTSTSSGQSGSLAGDITIPSNSYVWFYVVAQSGTVDEINVTFDYKED